MISFAVQKLVFAIRSHWFIFSFISVALGDWPKNTFVRLMLENVLRMFYSRSLMMSYLMFKSFSYFEFIFVHGVRLCSSFFDLSAAVWFCQHHLLKRLSFSHFTFLPPLSKINWPQASGFISGLSILFHWSVCLFSYYSFVILSEIWRVMPPAWFCSSGLLRQFWVSYGSI